MDGVRDCLAYSPLRCLYIRICEVGVEVSEETRTPKQLGPLDSMEIAEVVVWGEYWPLSAPDKKDDGWDGDSLVVAFAKALDAYGKKRAEEALERAGTVLGAMYGQKIWEEIRALKDSEPSSPRTVDNGEANG